METTGVYVKEIGACQGEPWDGRGQTVCFRWLSPFLKLV